MTFGHHLFDVLGRIVIQFSMLLPIKRAKKKKEKVVASMFPSSGQWWNSGLRKQQGAAKKLLNT